MNFFKDGLSVDEAKFSTLMLMLIVFGGVGLYMVFTVGDMPTNLTNFMYALVAGITGINIMKFAKAKNQQTYVDDSDMEDNHHYTDYDDYTPHGEVKDNAPV